jgi:lactate dehydrogenase-like 2-hydroxyacid dehydrogenase
MCIRKEILDNESLIRPGGRLIDEDLLKQMLYENKVTGAALDVFAIEPPIDTAICIAR